MNRSAARLALACTFLVFVVACSRSVTTSQGELEVLVVGTVVDAASGEPVPDAEVAGPDKHRARTHSDGRFQIAGLAAGTEGDLSVQLEDGRTGRVHLRPLRGGRLEVVLQLTRP